MATGKDARATIDVGALMNDALSKVDEIEKLIVAAYELLSNSEAYGWDDVLFRSVALLRNAEASASELLTLLDEGLCFL